MINNFNGITIKLPFFYISYLQPYLKITIIVLGMDTDSFQREE